MKDHERLSRRSLLKEASVTAGILGLTGGLAGTDAMGGPGEKVAQKMDDARVKEWLNRWEANILNSARTRYCDREMGEELGWLVSPFLNGFYYGYLATGDARWTGSACIPTAATTESTSRGS